MGFSTMDRRIVQSNHCSLAKLFTLFPTVVRRIRIELVRFLPDHDTIILAFESNPLDSVTDLLSAELFDEWNLSDNSSSRGFPFVRKHEPPIFSSVNCSRLSNNFMELFVSFHHLASIPEHYFQLTFNSFILSWRNFIFNNFRRIRTTIIISKKTRTHTYII